MVSCWACLLVLFVMVEEEREEGVIVTRLYLLRPFASGISVVLVGVVAVAATHRRAWTSQQIDRRRGRG